LIDAEKVDIASCDSRKGYKRGKPGTDKSARTTRVITTKRGEARREGLGKQVDQRPSKVDASSNE